MTNKGNTYLVDFIAGKQAKENPTILRIFINAAYTQIDFGYVAPWKYIRGGWIKIAPYSFLKVKGDNKKYNLIQAKNIPLAPAKFDFESTEDWRVFTLYFEPLPIKDCIFDIIEEVKPNANDFNYTGIRLQTKSKLKTSDLFS
jgi:hypothetical protein